MHELIHVRRHVLDVDKVWCHKLLLQEAAFGRSRATHPQVQAIAEANFRKLLQLGVDPWLSRDDSGAFLTTYRHLPDSCLTPELQLAVFQEVCFHDSHPGHLDFLKSIEEYSGEVTHDLEAADVANAMESILCALAAVPEAWPQHIRCALMWWCLNKDLPAIESLLDKWGFNLESLQEGFALALRALRLRVESLTTTPQTPYQKLLVRLGERVVCTVSSVLEEVDDVTVAALKEDIAVCAANDALVEAIRTAQVSSCDAVLAFTTQLDHHGLAQQFAQQLANSDGDLQALMPLMPLLPQALQAEFQRLTWMITGVEVVESSRRALLKP